MYPEHQSHQLSVQTPHSITTFTIMQSPLLSSSRKPFPLFSPTHGMRFPQNPASSKAPAQTSGNYSDPWTAHGLGALTLVQWNICM